MSLLKAQHKALLGWLLCLAALPGHGASAAECVKRMGWNIDVPYMMRNSAGTPVGLDIELAQAVMARLGCRLVLHEQPFARSLLDLESGDLDLLPSVFRRPERERFAWFSAPVYEAHKRLYLRRADLAAFRDRSLRDWLDGGRTLGVLPGVSYGPEYTELQQDPALRRQLHTVVSRRSLWLMLERGRIDGMLADERTGAHELQALGLRNHIGAAPLMVTSEPSHMAFSRQSTTEAFVRRFNAALEAMKADGSYATLLARYQLRPALPPH